MESKLLSLERLRRDSPEEGTNYYMLLNKNERRIKDNHNRLSHWHHVTRCYSVSASMHAGIRINGIIRGQRDCCLMEKKSSTDPDVPFASIS